MSTPTGLSSDKVVNGTVRTRPMILLITGSWHVPDHYTALIDSLKALGHHVSCPLLPSNSGQTPPSDLDEDIMSIRRHAKRLISDGLDLFVLMHSYGGMVGSYAFVDFPTPVARDRNPKHGCLRGLMYMTSFMPLAGEALNDILAPIFGVKGPPPFVRVDEKRNVNVLPPEAAAAFFYQDCSSEQQQRASRLLAEQSYDAQQHAPRKADVLKDLGVDETNGLKALKMSYMKDGIEVAYLYCDLDAGLTLPIQEMMVKRVKQRGVRVHEGHIDAGHSPFSNKPQETAVAVQEMIDLLH